jgi:hypothetical protein
MECWYRVVCDGRIYGIWIFSFDNALKNPDNFLDEFISTIMPIF